MKWRVLTWIAVVIGVLVAAGLGAYVAMAGVAKAAGPAGVIAAFCELGALILGMVGWVGERRAASTRREAAERAGSEPVSEPDSAAAGKTGSAERPHTGGRASKYSVDARGAQGVQIGENNVQSIGPRSWPPGPGQ